MSEKEIQNELDELKRYRDYANSCGQCRISESQCTHSNPSLMEKIRDLRQTSYMKPMLIIALCSFFTHFTGAHHLNPYLAQVLNTFQTPMQPSRATVRRHMIIYNRSYACVLYNYNTIFFIHSLARLSSVSPRLLEWSSA